jgi:exopolysaccharide biosynthesis polyprenyl glycosylphosphotransferase
MNLPDRSEQLRTLGDFSLGRQRVHIYLGLAVLDIIFIFAAFFGAMYLYIGVVLDDHAFNAAVLFTIVYLAVGIYNRTYSKSALNSVKFAIGRFLAAVVQASAVLLLLLFYAKVSADFSRVGLSISVAMFVVFGVASRCAAVQLIKYFWGGRLENVLIIDAGGPQVDLSAAFRINARLENLAPTSNCPDFLDRFGKLTKNMDRVIILCPYDEREQWTPTLRASGIQGELVSEPLHNLGVIGIKKEVGFTTLVVATGPLGLRARALKRIIDVFVASLALILLLPIMLIIASAIKLEDGGPVLFMQRRLGRGNCFFNIAKFRSMVVETSDHFGTTSASRQDQRITRIGRFIRRTSLDELPQLLNVLRGEMSLVGPRPHALGSQVESKLFWQIDDRYWYRHSIKPGVTGLAQIKGFRGATEQPTDLTERVRYDLAYIRDWSPWLDFWIMLSTFKVLIHKNAY